MPEVDLLSRETTEAGPMQHREENAKWRQILDGARKVFLADGFDGASMNEVARAAGVSKGTLYVYFADKEALFAALIRDEKRAQAEQLCRFDNDDGDVRATLEAFGVRLLELMLRPDSIAHFRTVIAVAAKFPTIGQVFYESGPLHGRLRLAGYMKRQAAAGRLKLEDPDLAAAQFLDLCKSKLYLEAILAIAPPPSRDAVVAQIGTAVDLFFRAYGPEAS